MQPLVATVTALLATSILATAEAVGADAADVRTAAWVEDAADGWIAFVPASDWYPDENGVLITIDGRIAESGSRPAGYDLTGPRDGSLFVWADADGRHDAQEGEIYVATGVDTDGEAFEFRYVHVELGSAIIPAIDWSTHPEHLRPPAYVEGQPTAPAVILPFAPEPVPAPATPTAPAAGTTPTTTAATAAAATTTPTTIAPSNGDGRPVVVADAGTVLDQPNTIYDFQNSSPGEVVILASNVEARNIRGGGARRIGARNGVSISDSGFRNFQFTFAHVQMSGGATITRPYFINGTDVNSQPHVGEGDIIQIFGYQGDIVSPLIDNVTVYGKQRPSGSDSHNDGIQFSGIDGGRVLNPTVRNSSIEGASSAGIQAKHVHGTFTIENNRLSERFESYHAVIAKPGDSSSTMLWRNNTMINDASAALTDGWSAHPSSDGSVDIS